MAWDADRWTQQREGDTVARQHDNNLAKNNGDRMTSYEKLSKHSGPDLENYSVLHVLQESNNASTHPTFLENLLGWLLIFGVDPAEWNRMVYILLLMQKTACSKQLLGYYG